MLDSHQSAAPVRSSTPSPPRSRLGDTPDDPRNSVTCSLLLRERERDLTPAGRLCRRSDLDGVPIGIGHVRVGHAWRVFASREQLPSGLIHPLQRRVDALGGTVRKVNAEVLPSSLLTDSLAFAIGRGEMQRERVAAVGRPKKHHRPIPEAFLHAEHIALERDRAIMLRDEQVNVTDPDRRHHGPLPSRRQTG